MERYYHLLRHAALALKIIDIFPDVNPSNTQKHSIHYIFFMTNFLLVVMELFFVHIEHNNMVFLCS